LISAIVNPVTSVTFSRSTRAKPADWRELGSTAAGRRARIARHPESGRHFCATNVTGIRDSEIEA